MGLVDKQAAFAQAVAKLLQKADELGYQVTFGDVNVFAKGTYLQDGSQYADLGEYWESIGGAWGGRFQDGNHFSFAHGGFK